MLERRLAFLVLTEDELALLRFTCDLTFVDESPLFFVEQQKRQPADMDAAYHNLIAKKVLDPETFALTDHALNRIAPVVEADAQVVHIAASATGEVEQKNFFLLDEIAVQYIKQDDAEGHPVHVFGDDYDTDELCEHVARRVLPRRAFGESIDVTLTELEFIAFSRLVQNAPAAADQLRIQRDAAFALLGEPPAAVTPGQGVVAMRGRLQQHRVVTKPTHAIGQPSATWERALQGLLDKRVFLDVDGALVLRPALVDFVTCLRGAERHTLVRYDFGDGEWVMRETTFVPTDGGLFYLGSAHERGAQASDHMRIQDVDGEQLKAVLDVSLGPLASYDVEATVPFQSSPLRR